MYIDMRDFDQSQPPYLVASMFPDTMKSCFSPPYSISSIFFLFILTTLLFNIDPSLQKLSNYHNQLNDHKPNSSYSQLELLHGVFGPESIAFDCHGEGPYAGVSDGRILKWCTQNSSWSEFATTSPRRDKKICDGSTNPEEEPICGRPLGIKFNPSTCDLYIADAYYGLLVVKQQGGLATQLSSSAEGIPYRFNNALDIDKVTGAVYFTDTSILFQRRAWLSSIMNGDKTGRLMKFDPSTKQVTVLLKGLAFPNGVALSKDSSFLLLAETGTLQILKIWLKGPKANTVQTLAQLQRFPDNVKSNEDGEFWVALNSGRSLQKLVPSSIGAPKTRNGREISWSTRDPVGIKFDEEGRVKRVLDGKEGDALESVSEVEEHGGRLWIGSAVKPYVGLIG